MYMFQHLNLIGKYQQPVRLYSVNIHTCGIQREQWGQTGTKPTRIENITIPTHFLCPDPQLSRNFRRVTIVGAPRWLDGDTVFSSLPRMSLGRRLSTPRKSLDISNLSSSHT